MNTYRDYIKAREISCMTTDEKLERKNSEILMRYSTVGTYVGAKSVTENTEAEAEAVKKETGKCRNMR